jgi:hypothetical protein
MWPQQSSDTASTLPRPRTRNSLPRAWLIRSLALVLPAATLLFIAPGATREPVQLQMPSQPAVPEAPGRDLSGMTYVLNGREGRASVAVFDSERVLYEQSGEQRHALASVAKVYILLTYLDKLAREQREPDSEEVFWLEAMIEESDNPSATRLWRLSGGFDGISNFLRAKGLPPIEPPENHDEWGTMRASAIDVGLLLSQLYQGWLLDPAGSALALDLLANVIEEQAWGVGIARQESGIIRTYFKNGWYPEEEGWIVNSAGIVAGPSGNYVIVLLTDQQPTMEGGIEYIEAAVRFVRSRLL